MTGTKKVSTTLLEDYLEQALTGSYAPKVYVDESGDLNVAWATKSNIYSCGLVFSQDMPVETYWWYEEEWDTMQISVTGNFRDGSKMFLDYLKSVLDKIGEEALGEDGTEKSSESHESKTASEARWVRIDTDAANSQSIFGVDIL